MLLLQPREDSVALIASNDSAQPWRDTVEVTCRHLDERTLATEQVVIDVPPGRAPPSCSAGRVQTAGDPAGELLVASCRLRTDVNRVDGGCEVAMTAETLVKDCVINVDRLDTAATFPTS